MNRNHRKKCGAALLSAALLLSSVPIAMAGETLPLEGDAVLAPNQPRISGQRIYDLEFWNEEAEEGADLLTAKIPLQERNEAFAPTQANPDLNTQAQILNLQGDYGNSFFEATPYNNTFSQYLFNYWQYTDYYASWHGITTKGTPMALYEGEERSFEFGLINMPNPAYTNAAHKNGAMSLGCIFLPRAGQTHTPMIQKDENGEFPIAKKLVEFANYYGFDGYFINQEAEVPTKDVKTYKEFTKYLIDNGLWIQWYDSITPDGYVDYQNELNEFTSEFIQDTEYGLGKVNSSLFVNYDWTYSNRAEKSLAYAAKNGINPFTEVFFGVECAQGKLSGGHNSARDIPQLYAPDTKNLRGSISLFTPSDWIQNGLDGDLYGDNTPNTRAKAGYQWMIAERERMFYSGVAQDPTNTGTMSGYENPTVGVRYSHGWLGVADFAIERSVINGATFYTNFNTGHGVEYFQNGQVVSENEWSNMNIQDILPSWQWWIDTEGAKLDVNFDYGAQYQELDKDGNVLDVGYQQVGAYNGGSSLVVSGPLDSENFLHLYKTNLQVNENTRLSVTYNKPTANDGSKMEIGVIFKNAPETVVTFNVSNSGQQTDGWVTKEIAVDSAYAGEEIAAIGLVFDNGGSAIENYQMNIGELKVTDGSVAKPAVPTNFKVSKAFDTNEMIVTWDIADYDQVKQYNLYANLSDGSRVYLGGTYDDTYYVKSLSGEQEVVTLELKAVAEDGAESDAATAVYRYCDTVSNIVVDEALTANGNKLQNANAGYMDITWDNPTVDYEAIEITVTPVKYWDYEQRNGGYTKTVKKGVSSARVVTPIADGSTYTLSMQVVFADGAKGEPKLYTGHFKDVYSDPYNKGIRTIGTRVDFETPLSSDWWHMYASVNGKPLTFGSREFAVRGDSNLDRITLPSSSGVIEVVLEDYSGNLSEPAYLPYGSGSNPGQPVTSSMFPDEILLNAVKEQIGSNTDELDAFTGTLDLSGTAVKDLTGLQNIRNLSSINLSNCTNLVSIYPNTFAGTSIKEINLTGCTSLQVLGLNDSNLEKIICDDAANMTDIVSVDLSDSRFDLSAGTPERAFVDAMLSLTNGKDDLEIADSEDTNMALNATIVEYKGISERDVYKLFDGKLTSDYIYISLPLTIVLDLGSEQTINSWTLHNDGASWGLKDFTISASSDGVNYTTIADVKNNTLAQVSGAPENARGRYIKLVGTKGLSYVHYLRELEIFGRISFTYPAGVFTSGQRPIPTLPEMPETVRAERKAGAVVDMQAYLENYFNSATTVRGTTLGALKDADFMDPSYDLMGALGMPSIDLIKITDAQGNMTMDSIDASKEGLYTVEYTTFNDANYQGRAVFTQTVYVRGITSVLEAVIAEAEQLKADGALENTMEAVVTEFDAALEAGKAMVEKDDAYQAEINAATLRLLAVMAKVDWKQGDKTLLEIAVELGTSIESNLNLYVEAGKQEFIDALAKGRALLNSGNAWQDDIDASVDRLIKAMTALRMTPNKDILNDMIANVQALDLSEYTADSAAILNSALAAAEAVAADANADQSTIDAAADTLDAALNGLVMVNGDANSNTSAGSTANVGEGKAPTATNTGDAGAAGLATLALISIVGVALLSKKRK